MLIYKCINLINGKIYIGQTRESLQDRKSGHINGALNRNYQTVFHKAIRKYGKDNFSWEVIGTANCQEELNHLETHYIVKYNSLVPNGYNMCPNGFGHSQTEETRKKIGIASTGRFHTETTKQKISNSEKGKVVSELTKLKQSLLQRGKSPSIETRKRISDKTKGRKQHPNSIEASRLYHTGRSISANIRLKIRETVRTQYLNPVKNLIPNIVNDYKSGKSKNHIQRTYKIGRQLCNRVITEFDNGLIRQSHQHTRLNGAKWNDTKWIYNKTLNLRKRINATELSSYLSNGWAIGKPKEIICGI